MNLFQSAMIVASLSVVSGPQFHAADSFGAFPVIPVEAGVQHIDWSGFYAGINAGYGIGYAYDAVAPIAAFGSMNGVFGGAQVGLNSQFDLVVFGVEADIQATAISQTAALLGMNDTIGIDYFGTVRGRVGADFDGILPYLTGGLAYGQGTISSPAMGGSDSQFHTGWTLGGGVEFALDQNVSIRTEYLFTELGPQTYTINGAPVDSGYRFHTIRAGANFSF